MNAGQRTRWRNHFGIWGAVFAIMVIGLSFSSFGLAVPVPVMWLHCVRHVGVSILSGRPGEATEGILIPLILLILSVCVSWFIHALVVMTQAAAGRGNARGVEQKGAAER
jgi:hypothetical protein